MPTKTLQRPRNRFRTEYRPPVVPRTARVSSINRPAPGVMRVTLDGPQLGVFNQAGREFPALTSTGFDDVVVLCFPDPFTGEIQLPTLNADGQLLRPESGSWRAREYTVRSHAPERNEVVIDFMLHGFGVADSWVRTAMVGDQLGLISPRMCRALPEAAHLIAIGDATALPAVSRLLDEAPEHITLDVYLAADRATTATALPRRRGTDVHWIEWQDRPLQVLGEMLAARPPQPETSWAWIAGESALVTSVRRILVDAHAMDRDRIQFTGYWRRDSPSFL